MCLLMNVLMSLQRDEEESYTALCRLTITWEIFLASDHSANNHRANLNLVSG